MESSITGGGNTLLAFPLQPDPLIWKRSLSVRAGFPREHAEPLKVGTASGLACIVVKDVSLPDGVGGAKTHAIQLSLDVQVN